MYNVKFVKGKFHVIDPSYQDESVAYSRSKKKAIQFSQDLMIQGFEGEIPHFFFAGSPINLDQKPTENNIYN